MIRKSISVYSDRKQINIGKNELVDASDVVIYTLDEHKNITSKIQSLNDTMDALKEQVNDKTNKINDYESNLNKSIEDAVSEYQDAIKEHQELIHHQNKLIKDYQDSDLKHNEKVSELNGEINSLKMDLVEMINLNDGLINRYNNLWDAVSTLSRVDVLLNRQQDIINRYPKLTDSIDALAIDTSIKE